MTLLLAMTCRRLRAAALIVGDGGGEDMVAEDREVVEADIPVIVACLEGGGDEVSANILQ